MTDDTDLIARHQGRRYTNLIGRNRERRHQLLRELVARPSINPAFVDDPAVSGEERVAELLIDHARGGLDIRRQAVLPGRKIYSCALRPPARCGTA